MSSKRSNDKYEPIKLDTTILKIHIKSTGDLITKEYDLIPFHPNMSDMKDLGNNNYILFPSFVKITMNYLKNAGVGEDYKKVFTNLEKYIQLIKFVTKIDKEMDEDFTLLVDQTQYKNYAMSFAQDFVSDITMDFRAVQKYEPLTDEEIITNNIGIIKNIFLPVNGRFFILGHEYIIAESKYLPPYKSSDVVNEKLSEQKKVPLNYSITVELLLLDIIKNPGIGDFSKLSCKQKKISLNKDIKEIFGQEFGYKEEIKAVLPPLTPTTTSKRGFGKLQLDWEERNKYVKPPTTEKERIEMERKWSPLQKKMSQLDKVIAYEYNKIPPLWIKENNELNLKYDAFEKEMKGYAMEIENIKKVNPKNIIDNKYDSFVEDLINVVKNKMKIAVEQLLPIDDKLSIDDKAKVDESLKDYDSPNNSSKLINIIKIYKEHEKKKIDDRNTEPFLKELKEREKDVIELKEQNNKLKEDINQLKDTYQKNSKQQELSKVQAELLKKQTDYKLLVDKYGENGEKLVKKWQDSFDKMESLKKNITSDKENNEKKILNDSVSKELDTKLKEIKEMKKKLYKANYFEGEYQEITKKEGSEFSKKPGERPIESVDELEKNIERLKEEYLDIANKLGMSNKMQSYITLLNDDMERIKKLKKGMEEEKSEKESELKKIVYELEKLSNIQKKNKNSEKEGGRETTLKEEQKKLEDKIKPLILKIDLLKAYEKFYNDKITNLRQHQTDNVNINELKDDFEKKRDIYIKSFKSFDDIGNNPNEKINISNLFKPSPTSSTSSKGGKNSTKRLRRYRKQYKKTKRLNNKTRPIKKRYTRRRY